MKTQSRSILRATICAGALLLMLFSAGAAYAGRVVVEVTDCNGNGVAGATVELWRVDPGPPRAETRVDEKTTAANGTVEFAPVKDGTYLVRVGCPNGDYLPTDDENHDFTVKGNRTVYQRFKCCPGSGSGKRKASTTTGGGLHTSTFITPQGNVIVNLPDDMRAGDTISGTVVAEPKGQTPEERTKNLTELNGYVIELEMPRRPDGTSNPKVTAQVTATLSPFMFTLPSGSTLSPTDTIVSRPTPAGLGITLTNTSGSLSTGGTTSVPIEMVSLSLQSVAPLKIPQLPSIGQQGRLIEIYGPFDGNSSNTSLNWTRPRSAAQDFEKNTENVSGGFGLIAETSRGKAVFECPAKVTGPIEITLTEGNTKTTGTYRNVGVKLSAPKTNLLKGERTKLRVDWYLGPLLTEPVPAVLTAEGVITMEGGNYQQFMIQPSQVGADGTFTITREITGVQTGAWGATATVVTHKFDFCLQDDSNPGNVVFVNARTGDYLFPSGGTSLSGQGTVTRNGCTITLTDSPPDRRVQSTIDPCTKTGSASVQIFSSKIKVTITDKNMSDNTCSCGPGCK